MPSRLVGNSKRVRETGWDCRCQVSIYSSHAFHSRFPGYLCLVVIIIWSTAWIICGKCYLLYYVALPGRVCVLFICSVIYVFLETRSCCVARTVLELMMYLRLALNLFVVFLLLPPVCQDYRPGPLSLIELFFPLVTLDILGKDSPT